MTSIITRHVMGAVTRNASVCMGLVARRSVFRVAASNLYTEKLLDTVRLQSKCDCPCNCLGRVGMCTAQTDYVATDVNIEEVVHGVLKQDMILIDVRRAEELRETGGIGQAINIPVDEVDKAFALSDAEFKKQYNADKPSTQSDKIVIYCRSGKRALTACETLHKLGYSGVKRYPGSMIEWEETLLGSTFAHRHAATP